MPKRIPWYAATLLCIIMLLPGAVTFMLTAYPGTYRVGTFYGVVCIIVFAACGIYHRRKPYGFKEMHAHTADTVSDLS